MKTKNSYLVLGIDTLSQFLPLSIEDIIFYTKVLLDLSRGRSNIKGRENDRRGYLTILDAGSGKIIFTFPFGEIPADKAEKYYELSQEKSTRLFAQVNMHLPNGHTTSFQSRDEKNGQYGGAVYAEYQTRKFIFSFSGMPELIDEAMMLVLARYCARQMRRKIMIKIEAQDRNPYWVNLNDDFLNHSMILLHDH